VIPAAASGLGRRRTALGIALALALAAALVAVAWLQVRQYRALDTTVRYQDDYLQVSLAQLQIEFLRLRAALHDADNAASADAAAHAAVQLRYDIFVSRVDLLQSGRAERLLGGLSDFRQVVMMTSAFVDHADQVLGPEAKRPFDAAAVNDLLAHMQPLDSPLQSLVLAATHGVSVEVAERLDKVREQGRIGVLLTALLAVSSVGFALIAFALARREALRRRALEKLTDELRLAQREAESASQAKTAFLANMSHEIRTPFQGLLGMLQLLDRDQLAPDQHRRLETARNSALHLLAVLDDVLDMSRLEAGTLTLTPQPVDLRALVADVQALMEAPAQAKALALHVHIDPALPALALLDGTRVRQILFNLLSNAIKFTDHGSVTLDLRAERDALLMTVTDTGIGIDERTRARLFQRFSPGDASRSRRHGGTGLGLEISRNLARLMGGDITLESTLGQGSRFAVRLPLQAVAAELQPPAAPAPSGTPGTRRLRVLAAEDNDVNREVLAAMIGMHDHEVSFAHNGREAVEAMRSQRVDLVLMDLHMPEMDGIEAARAIRALPPPAANVPIVALTADVFADTRARCVEAGMNDFLTKPVGVTDLGRLLERYAAEPQTQRA
jgi:signal transduction histidine kinase/ActR/RegA family two-component response regulator